jgi:hypothetical protein
MDQSDAPEVDCCDQQEGRFMLAPKFSVMGKEL